MSNRKKVPLILITCLITTVSCGYKCEVSNTTTPIGSENYSGVLLESKECCKAEHEEGALTVTHFHCQNGCCGEKDSQYCCSPISNNEVPYVVGGSIAGVLVVGGVIGLLVWLFRKSCHCLSNSRYDWSDHKKLLKEVYLAETLDELIVPNQQLVSAPGTIIHPTMNVNGAYNTVDTPSYVMPDISQHQVLPEPLPAEPPEHGNNDDDDNEENWDTWDGFPNAGHAGISAISGTDSAGRGRDNPCFQETGEAGAGGDGTFPYYYEHYDRYSQPPPQYEEVTNNDAN